MKKKFVYLIIASLSLLALLAAPLNWSSVIAVTNETTIRNTHTQLNGDTLLGNPGNSHEEPGSIVEIAYEYEGAPYSFGGGTPEAFDYSGYTAYVYNQAGVELPRTAAAQFAHAETISQSEAKPGDLIFFNQTGRVDHVGIYVGDGEFISSQSSEGVVVSSFDTGYWSNFVVGFGRAN